MKQQYYIWKIFIFLFLIASCTNNQPSDLIKITRESFETSKFLNNPEEIPIEDLLNPVSFNVMYDSIIIVQNQPNCEYLLELYSMKSLHPIAKMIKKGNGPNEMTSCITFIHSSDNPSFLIQDRNTNTYYLADLDSMLIHKRAYFSKKINFGHNVHPDYAITSLDENVYFGYNMWYLNDKEYSSSNKPIIKASSDNEETELYHKNFVASVNGAQLIPLNRKRGIMLADAHSDNIKIFDDSLKIIKEIIGPDMLLPTYVSLQNDSPEYFITFANERFFRAYTNYTISNDFIYLIYEGNPSFDPMNLAPVEVFKFDFNGNPICRYKLDRYISNISIDSKSEFMYGTYRKSVAEYPVLIKYKL